MKSIHITGKNNIDKMHNATNENEDKQKAVRNQMIDLPEEMLEHKKQLEMVNKLFLGDLVENKKWIEREIEKKIQGYKQQDIKKYIYNSIALINLEEVLEKMVIAKLKCYYCKQDIFILYKDVRYPMQWTLDRKDNDLCHSKENTLIACLKCNLQRRVTDVDKFTFTKHLRIHKS